MSSGWYYLMSQLPAFPQDVRSELQINEQYFIELCSRFLDKKTFCIIEGLSLEPPRSKSKTGSAFLDTWYEKERLLRLSLAQLRALRMKKEFNLDTDITFPPEIQQIARNACGYESPLEAEIYMCNARLNALNSIMPYDNFSTEAVIAYALKLKLIVRIQKFDEQKGMTQYRSIYNQILGEST